MRFVLAALLAVAAFSATEARAQLAAPNRTFQWELRAEGSVTPSPGAFLGGGVNIPAGAYARVGAVLSAGVMRDHGETFSAQRGDLIVRFLLDPYAERRLGLYLGGGIGGMIVDGDGSGHLVFVVGAEGSSRGRIVPAVEAALGGGARIAVVLRQNRGRDRR